MRVIRGVLIAALCAVLVGTAAVFVVMLVRGNAARSSGGAPTVTAAPEVEPASLTTVATGLRVPWDVAFLPDGTALVTERVRGSALVNEPNAAHVLSVAKDGTVTVVQRLTEVVPRGEAGLLGIAVSPTYATDRWVYAYYTTANDNRIVRFHLGGPVEPILVGIPAGEFHAGGRIAFGPDGMLYAGTGETYFTPDIAQDPNSLGGKILRITPEGKPAPGNPYGDSPVWSIGHRNVQGLAWDSRGRLFASELGADHFDELNLIEPGRNYGWPVVEGVGDDPRFVDPVATWSTADASPSGIAIVGDRVYVACLRGQRLYRLRLDGTAAQTLLVGDYGRLRHVAPAPDGTLWILTSNRDGRGAPTADDDRILRLTP